jgi:hypothetical protein
MVVTYHVNLVYRTNVLRLWARVLDPTSRLRYCAEKCRICLQLRSSPRFLEKLGQIATCAWRKNETTGKPELVHESYRICWKPWDIGKYLHDLPPIIFHADLTYCSLLTVSILLTTAAIQSLKLIIALTRSNTFLVLSINLDLSVAISV